MQKNFHADLVVVLKGRATRSIFSYSTVGLQLAITVLVFIYIGSRVDDHFKTTPWFFILSVFVGMGVGFYNLIRELKNIDRFIDRGTAGESPEREKRTKWL